MNMKLCPTCKREKDVADFAKSGSTRDGLNWQCKSCHSERMKAMRQRNAEHVAELPAERKCSTCKTIKSAAEFNRSKLTHDGLCNVCRSCEKTYRKVRKEKNKAANENRCSYAGKRCSNCDRVLPPEAFGKDNSRVSGLKSVCRDCDSLISLEWRRKNAAKVLLKSARNRAKENGIPFSIKLEDVYVPAFCPVLRIPLEVGGERFNSPSLDRIDNTKGYEPGNVIVVSLRANRLKSDATLDELIALAEFYSLIQI